MTKTTVISGISLTLLILCFITQVSCAGGETITLYPIADSFIDSANPEKNYGGEPSLFVRNLRLEYGATIIERSYLLFDMAYCKSLIPPGASIDQAVLTFHVSWAGYERSLYVQSSLDSSWTENSITWNNAPKYGIAITSIAIRSMKQYSLEVTDLIRGSLDEDVGLLTLVFTLDESSEVTDYIQIDSKEAPVNELRPKLVVTYTSIPVTARTSAATTITVTQKSIETVIDTLTTIRSTTFTTLIESPSPTGVGMVFALLGGLALGLTAMYIAYPKIRREKETTSS